MRAFTRLRPFLSGLFSLVLLAGCTIKGSVRLYPQEPEALVYESKVMVSEDLNPPLPCNQTHPPRQTQKQRPRQRQSG